MSIYTRKEMAMLYDASKCTGCKGCQVACKQWNVLYSDLGMNAFPFSGSYQNPQDLNGSNRLVMTFKEKKSDNQLRPVEWAFGQLYKDIYSEQIACERGNDRVLNDYFL